MDKILVAARELPTQLGITRAEHRSFHNFQKLREDEIELLMGEAIDEGFGLGVMPRVQCAAKRVATPVLEEIQTMAGR